MTIAGCDPSAGAGIQADLKTFAALGVYGTSVITAITVQNTQGVFRVEALSPELVAAQIDAVVSDIGADVVKTGMLADATIVEVVAAKLRQYGLTEVVVDPVLEAKGGVTLLPADGLAVLREAGLVEVREDGKQTFYRLNQKQITACCGELRTTFAAEVLPAERVT